MTPMAQSTSSVIPRSNFESMTDSTFNSATATVDEDRDSPTERHGVSDRCEDRETRVLPDEFEEVFEHLRSLTFFREGSGVRKIDDESGVAINPANLVVDDHCATKWDRVSEDTRHHHGAERSAGSL